MSTQALLFSADALPQGQTIYRPGGVPQEEFFPYLPDNDLVQAVNLALWLKRPLLLMGEPGCGKSQLARVLAYALYFKTYSEPTAEEKEEDKGYVVNKLCKKHYIKQDYRNYYVEWSINSGTKAREGLYEYDAIRRLGDAQLLARKGIAKKLEKPNYITLGPMGRAFQNSTEESRVVLLIDEIDKADLDFSNDLLNELDRSRFTITETGEQIIAAASPIVIITSNGEKELPDAFLRRCVFHRIEPFSEEKLQKIVWQRFFPNLIQATEGPESTIDTTPAVTATDTKDIQDFIDKTTKKFINIRSTITRNRTTIGSKSVSTAEFLDWFSVINHYRNITPQTDAEKAMVKEAESLEETANSVPFRQTLLKHASMLSLFPAVSNEKLA